MSAADYVLAKSLLQKRVRFNDQINGGPVHIVTAATLDGMIELHDMGGQFSPTLFTIADDIGDIPPSPESLPPDAIPLLLRGTLSRVQGRLGAILERDKTKEAAINGPGVGISYLFARDIACALERGAAEIERLQRALRNCARNDGTVYDHHQPRRWDSKKPSEAPEHGSIWLTPREIARAALHDRTLATFDDEGEE